MILFHFPKRLRPFAGAIVFAALPLLSAGSGMAATHPDSNSNSSAHGEALKAAADLQAAIGRVDAAAGLTSSGSGPYKQMAAQALNLLVGRDSPDYDAAADKAAGGGGDKIGALAHLQSLLQQSGKQPWEAGVRSAWVNAMVARARLKDAQAADELDAFQSDSSGALEALLVAAGNDAQFGALGGLKGALATTALGVPSGGTVVDGCAAPTAAPAYGVTNGHLIYVALPSDGGSTRLPEPIGIRDVSRHNGFVVLHTAATDRSGALCAGHDEAKVSADPNIVAAADPAAAPAADPAAAAGPRLFTPQQAKAGRQVYAQACAVCHGDKLQGKSAPPIAGHAFLNKAKILGWSVSDLRSLVTTTMPRSDPGSLSPEQYADVLSYLLAANCYPSGDSKFPTQTTARLKGTPFGPVKKAQAGNGAADACVAAPDGQKKAQN